jgi:hypothetical protein
MKKVLSLIAVVMCVSMFTGCTTMTTVGGVAGGHGLLSSFGASGPVSSGKTEIASYTVWLNLFDAGYSEYISAVEQAVSDGKLVTSSTKFFIFFNKTTAYAK